jgi:hypothetical protein
VLNVKANLDNEVSSTCAKLFPKQVTPNWWGRATPLERAVRATRLARAE